MPHRGCGRCSIGWARRIGRACCAVMLTGAMRRSCARRKAVISLTCSSCACAAAPSRCWSGRCGRPIGRMPAPGGRKWGEVRLQGWSRQRRAVLLRRRLGHVLLTQRSAGDNPAAEAPLQLGFVEFDADRQAWEYAVLVTSLEAELLTIAQLYRDRGDAENNFDELKNQWGWGERPQSSRCAMMRGRNARAVSRSAVSGIGRSDQKPRFEEMTL